MFEKLLYLGLAGAAGTIARYGFSGFIQRNLPGEFPFGTAAVNIVGCLLFGLLWALVENRLSISSQARTLIFIGFFGAFTTFSSFAYETARMLDDSQWLWASANILLHNAIGIVSLIAGLAVGKTL
jgi:CrcB protein